MQDMIHIYGATENNLKDVSLSVPKKQITVFTGVSGSGKSSLCLDTIAAESRRELNETFPSFVQQYLPKYGRPHVERIENLPVTIVIDQKKPAGNTRSTVGTYTDIYSLLRLLFSRVGKPFIGYSDSFSFNHPAGKCERCDGIGTVTELDIHKLVDFDKCLNDEDVIHFPTFTTGAWRWKRYAYSGLFDLNKKIRDYSEEELNLFLYSPQIRLKNPPSNWPKSAKFEGMFPRMYRSIITTKEGKRQQKVLDKMVSTFICPECHGARVNERVRSCLINGKNIAEVVDLPIPEAIDFVNGITDPEAFTTVFRENETKVTGNPVRPDGYILKDPVTLDKTQWEKVLGEGDYLLALHIPGGEGYTPERVRRSCLMALDFFDRYYPEYRYIGFWSESWLYDPGLAALLGPERNISRVSRQFYCYPTMEGDDMARSEVLHDRNADYHDFRARTTLEKRLFAAWDRGERFHTTGMFLLREEAAEVGNDPYRKED